jgi:hypothetical protein
VTNFGSFRIADFLSIWLIILVVGNDVFMRYMHMNLLDKRFRPAFAEALRAGRSKASSARRLSPYNFEFSNMAGSFFWQSPLRHSLFGERGG